MDPLDLDVRLARLLATGRYVSTYELATLDALVQHCLENPVPDDAGLTVTIRDPATRVVETYGPQVRAFGLHAVLRQNEQTRPGTATLLGTIRGLRQQAKQRALRNATQFRIADPASGRPRNGGSRPCWRNNLSSPCRRPEAAHWGRPSSTTNRG